MSGIYNSIDKLLLHRCCKVPGIICFIAGILVIALSYLYSMKPAWLEFNVFAIHSYYLQPRVFVTISNNLTDEIGLFLSLVGLIGFAFSRLSSESPATIGLRVQAMILSVYINSALMIFFIATIYGLSIFYIFAVNLFSGILIYYIIFIIKLIVLKKRIQSKG